MESLREVFTTKRRLFERRSEKSILASSEVRAAEVSTGLCLLSSGGTIYSFWKINEIWKNPPEEIMNVSTTVVGAIGSFTDGAEVVGHMLELARNRIRPGARANLAAAEAREAGEIVTVTRFAKSQKR